ncbi:phosphotransferase [Neobacillus sp. PS3-34]|uniref:phosphotransferase n=1 Tax=Neobacillus sp. PS3-34 TaxID=3070678 RepID=UPI0027DEB5C8|nr:phosphotransferase [Neobacillus sp. PS3-34]WML48800.1 phosphotransferase [Neobacillus sp. PS3-34]
MNRQLREKVEEIIGEIRKVKVLDEQGCTSEVLQIHTDGGSYFLKSSFKEKYRKWLKAEALVLEKLNGKNLIPVPKYYGFIEGNNSSHIIMSFEKGITLTSALRKAKTQKEKRKLITSFGKFLYQLHETTIIESLKHENDWLEEQLVRAEGYVKNGQAEGSLQLLEKLKSAKPLPVQQTLIHGDCTTDNVLVMDGEVSLFIDVAGITVGDPRYDISLAIRSFVKNDEYKKSFYEGYQLYTVSIEEFQYFDEGLYEFF